MSLNHEPLGVIVLNHTSECVEVREPEKFGLKMGCFCFFVRGWNRTMNFHTTNDVERRSWVEAINYNITVLKARHEAPSSLEKLAQLQLTRKRVRLRS